MKTLISPGVVQVMIDMETLDVRPDSHILSIAAVPFLLDAAEEIDFLMGLDRRGVPAVFHEYVQLPDILRINDTFKWHLRTGTGVVEASATKGIALDAALAQVHFHVSAWASEESEYYIWGWGYGFDLTILAETYRSRPPRIWKPHTYEQGSSDGLSMGHVDRKWVLADSNLEIRVGSDPPNYELPYWLKCYWRNIDARSVFLSHGGFWKEYAASREGKHHDALDDAKHQVKVIQQIYGGDA